MSNRAIPEMLAETRLLYQRLRDTPEGETVTYEELSALIGRDVANGARGLLTSARRLALNEQKALFETVRKVGLKRLTNEAIPGAVSTSTISRIRHTTRRGIRKLQAARYDELSTEKQTAYNTAFSLLSTFQHFTSEATLKKVEKAVEVSRDVLPLQKTIEAFQGS